MRPGGGDGGGQAALGRMDRAAAVRGRVPRAQRRPRASTCRASGARASRATCATRSPSTRASSSASWPSCELQRVQLVMHDWGAVGLAFAQRHPERVERLVLINAVPLLPGQRMAQDGQIWRTPGLGELAMGCSSRSVLRLLLERGQRHAGAAARQLARQRARPFRPGDPARDPAPVPQRAARAARRRPAHSWRACRCRRWSCGACGIPTYRRASRRNMSDVLGSAQLLELADAGHWPWLDRPDVIDTVVAFLAAGRASTCCRSPRPTARRDRRAPRGLAGAATRGRAPAACCGGPAWAITALCGSRT